MTGEELKNLRKKYGYTQKSLAEELEMERVRITQWETGAKVMGHITSKMFKFFFELKQIRESAKI